MGKLNITKEELEGLYREELDILSDEFDWITAISDKMVCSLIKTVLYKVGVNLNENRLHELYSEEVSNLNLTITEWRDTYNISKIISMIYDIIEKRYDYLVN